MERVVYFNEENNFTVARLQVPGRQDLVPIVGHMPCPNPGETLRLQGQWANDPKHGIQFRAESCLTVLPSTLTGIEKYLGSRLIKGIGPVMAKRIVACFGLDTLDVIEQSPERLLEVEGIGPVRSQRIARAWQEQKEVRQVMVFLQGHGVSSTYAVKIYKTYGDQSVSIVQENPYRLALDISGIGFKTADRIARNLGIDPGSQIRAEAGLIHVLSELVDHGHVFYPHDQLIEKAGQLLEVGQEVLTRAMEALRTQGKVVIEGQQAEAAVYLAPLHASEVNVARRLKALLEAPKKLVNLDVERALAWVQQVNKIALASQQQEAIRRAFTGKALVITGGPGTGKTTLVNCLIRILERMGQRTVLASPTGRAAHRLSEVSGKEAKTIHRLLEYSPREGGFQRDEARPLEADVVVIDEASMVDIVLMNHLLKAIPPTATLVLVGDVDQLPSVGPGNVLRDIIASGGVQTVRLTQIFRQAQESLIVVNAHRVNRGQLPQPKPDPGKRADFYFFERNQPEPALEAIKHLCGQRIPQAFHLDPVQDIQVITPMHRGTVGVANLNAELQALLNPEGQAIAQGGRLFRVGDKVMQTRNNYEKDVFNGDIGRIAGLDPEEQGLQVRVEDRTVSYEWNELDELVLAYAISIHKSQGSEYPAVVVPILPQHYVMLQRNLLYTALTRARKLVVLVGSRQAIAMAIRNNRVQSRYTHLVDRLRPSGR